MCFSVRRKGSERCRLEAVFNSCRYQSRVHPASAASLASSSSSSIELQVIVRLPDSSWTLRFKPTSVSKNGFSHASRLETACYASGTMRIRTNLIPRKISAQNTSSWVSKPWDRFASSHTSFFAFLHTTMSGTGVREFSILLVSLLC